MTLVKSRKLGEILVESGTISPEQLDLALMEQKQTGEKLGRVLQRLGICSEREIGRVLADQAGVDSISLAGVEVDKQAVALVPREFAETKSLLPLQRRGGTLRVAMSNPLDLATIDELGRITGKYIEVVHAPESDIADAIVLYYGASEDDRDGLTELIEASKRALAEGARLEEGDSPFIRLVDALIAGGVEAGATDIHFEPDELVLRCRYRIDGRLLQGAVLPRELHGIVITRLKIMAEMDISESRVPQDGRIIFTRGRRQVELRVSSFPTVNGESIVCRILDKEALIVGLHRLGMPEHIDQSFRRDIARPHGIILVTGPTGSGKTTTLYSALTFLNKPDTKILTLEDPVEYELSMVNQAQINTAQGFTFAKGLRAILRQDPDILLVGEIRDVETAQLAIRAALTGHLVFSTLHTNSAAGAIPRLLDMGVESFLLSASLIGVLAQRLVRTVCPRCGEPTTPDEDSIALLGLTPEFLQTARFRAGRGCDLCRKTGYRGRVAVFEYLRVEGPLRRMIAERSDAERIAAAAAEMGMKTLRDDALAKLHAGQTTVQEVLRVIA